jgi:hypothetical protein
VSHGAEIECPSYEISKCIPLWLRRRKGTATCYGSRSFSSLDVDLRILKHKDNTSCDSME